MMTVYSPLTWGMYTEPPPDIPECGFVGELCPAPVRGIWILTIAEMQSNPMNDSVVCGNSLNLIFLVF